MRRIDRYVQNLNVVVHNHTAGNADDMAVIMRHPPGARSGKILRQLIEEKLRRPRLMACARKADASSAAAPSASAAPMGRYCRCLPASSSGNACCLGVGAFAQAQPAPLIFLGIGQARVDGQHARRVTIAHGLAAQQALPRGPPQRTLQATSSFIFGKQLAIADKAIARQTNLCPVGTLAPFVQSNSGLNTRSRSNRRCGPVSSMRYSAG